MGALDTWKKSKPVEKALETMGGLWSSRGGGKSSQGIPGFSGSPTVDLSEDDKEIVIKAEVPGLTQKDLEVSYTGGYLTLKGEKRQETEDRKKGSYYRESWYGKFSRTIPVGQEVEWEKANAQYRDGVLRISIPKRSGAPEKTRIKIQ